MALKKQTKLFLNNDKFQQLPNDELNLSGSTTISSGGTFAILENNKLNRVLSSGENGVVKWSEVRNGLTSFGDEIKLGGGLDVGETLISGGSNSTLVLNTNVFMNDSGTTFQTNVGANYLLGQEFALQAFPDFGGTYSFRTPLAPSGYGGDLFGIEVTSSTGDTPQERENSSIGLYYNAKLHDSFIARSLPDVEYVTGITNNLQQQIDLISGGSVNQMSNVGEGLGDVFRDITGNTFNLRKIRGSGDTTVITEGDTIIVHTDVPEQAIPVTGASNGLSLSGQTVVLGGELVENTEIELNYNDLLVSSLFTPFDSGDGFNNTVRIIAVQSDGKILVGGEFTEYNQESVDNLIRLNVDGSIDDGFSIGDGFNNTVRVIAVQSDGKILIGGNFTEYDQESVGYIVRLNPDGSIDSSFETGNGFNFGVYSITIQDDNKILVGGEFFEYDGQTARKLVRLNLDGSIDSSFDMGVGFFGAGIIYDIKIQSDNKIVVGGSFLEFNLITYRRIFRLNSDGSPDNSFIIGDGFEGGDVRSIGIQDDDKILVGGSFTSYSGETVNRIVRLNVDGSIDDGFSIGDGFNGVVRVIAVQSDGKILIGGNFTEYDQESVGYIVRLNPDGSIDSSFETGNGFNSIVYSITIQDDNKILVGGSFIQYDGQTATRIVILNPDGSIDDSETNVDRLLVHDDGVELGGNIRLINSPLTANENYGILVRDGGNGQIRQIQDISRGLLSVGNIGDGEGEVFDDISNNTINLRTIKGSGETTVTTSGDEIIVYTEVPDPVVSFSGLTDTPNNYQDSAGKFVVVNNSEDGLVFSAITTSDEWTGGTRYILVKAEGTDIENATELRNAYDKAKTMSPSSDNRVVVLAAPGNYNLETTLFNMDTQYIDLVSLDGNRSIVFNSLNSNGTIIINNHNIFVKGVDVLDNAFLFGGSMYNSRFENCKGGNQSFGYIGSILEDCVFINCEADDNSFGFFNSKLEGCYFENCQAGIQSFGFESDVIDSEFLNCRGGDSCFGAFNFTNQPPMIDSNSRFENCRAGNQSFGYFATQLNGVFINCEAGNQSFGGDGTEFNGRYENCRAGDQSFGYYIGVVGQPTYNGTFIGCRAGIQSFGFGAQYIEGFFKDCVAGNESFGSHFTGSGVEYIIADFINCIAGDGSFGRDCDDLGGKFINCQGGNNSFGESAILVSGEFIDCVASGYSFCSNVSYSQTTVISGRFINCVGADQCFGAGDTYINGFFKNCVGGNSSFGAAFTLSPTADAGELVGDFIDCEGGSISFGGSNSNGGVLSGKFINCKQISGFGGFGATATVTSTAYFKDCFCDANNGFGRINDSGSTFINCRTVRNGFGIVQSSGTYTNCQGGNNLFGGNGGLANGKYVNCQAGDNSFGGGGGIASGHFFKCNGGDLSFGGGTSGVASGLFVDCVGGDHSFGGDPDINDGVANGDFIKCIGGVNSFATDSTNDFEGKLMFCLLLIGVFKMPVGDGVIISSVDGSNNLFTIYPED